MSRYAVAAGVLITFFLSSYLFLNEKPTEPKATNSPAQPSQPVPAKISDFKKSVYGRPNVKDQCHFTSSAAAQSEFHLKQIKLHEIVANCIPWSGGKLFIASTPNLISRGMAPPSGLHQNHRLIADFNGDNLDDLLIVYSSHPKSDSHGKHIQLYFSGLDGRLKRSKQFTELDLRCRTETPIMADFDNDADIDIFIPCYTHQGNGPWYESFFLVNDGKGNFRNAAREAGIQMLRTPYAVRAEGAQAFDVNEDGWLDIYVASRLYINNKDGTFSDRREDYGLPIIFDEGLKFIDVNADGEIDAVFHVPTGTARVFLREKGKKKFKEALCSVEPGLSPYTGMNMADLDLDGYPDMVLGAGPASAGQTFVARNNRGTFLRTKLTFTENFIASPPSFVDVDGDGDLDLVRTVSPAGNEATYEETFQKQVYVNGATRNKSITVELLGRGERQNQHARRVVLTPKSAPDMYISGIVDGGSGYFNQNQYPLVLGAPVDGLYSGKAYFKGGIVEFSAQPGDFISVKEDGSSVKRTLPNCAHKQTQ